MWATDLIENTHTHTHLVRKEGNENTNRANNLNCEGDGLLDHVNPKNVVIFNKVGEFMSHYLKATGTTHC